MFIPPDIYISKKDSLFLLIKNFISQTKSELLIISPYINTQLLEDILKTNKSKVSIITTWKLRDIQFGSSDLELYRYCKKNKHYLYLNQRIHLKACIIDNSSGIFGSANITNKGLGLSNRYNYELGMKINKLDIKEIIYFRKILKESILVNDEIYNLYKDSYIKLKQIPKIKEPDINKLRPSPEFLISSLPMSKDIDELYEIYSNDFQTTSDEKKQCAIHDIVLYNIPQDLTRNEFYSLLKDGFFKSMFVIKLLDFIEDGRYFGEVKVWIQNNCKDVPVPSRRDLTGNIQALYKWIVDLGEGEYKMDRPHHSQRIYKKGSYL